MYMYFIVARSSCDSRCKMSEATVHLFREGISRDPSPPPTGTPYGFLIGRAAHALPGILDLNIFFLGIDRKKNRKK